MFCKQLSRTWMYRIFGLSLLPLAGAASLAAQAIHTADRPSEITVFGSAALSSPHYGPDYNTGVSFGAEFTRYLHFPVAPAFQVRADYTSGTQQSEHAILFGLSAKLRLPTPRIRPYITGLAGVGTITFNPAPYPSYTKDTGKVYSGGGGVEFDVIRNFRARFDFQQQIWNFGPDGVNSTFVIHPRIGTVGIVYQIPFRPYTRHGDERRTNY